MNATLTRDGRVAIPKHIRDLLGFRAGSPVVFTLTEDGHVLLTPVETQRPPSRFAALRGVATFKMRTDEIMALMRGKGREGSV
jgi:AbrB family looped-hinge helix DNA binding protein